MNLHQALLKVKAGERCAGICASVLELMCKDCTPNFNVYMRISNLSRHWPEFSGNISFPVPCEDRTPQVAYISLPHWEGEYGAARLRLLDYLIEVTKDAA